VFGLNANLSGIVDKLIGFPLEGEAAGFGYSLLSASAGLSVDVRQNFSFDPKLQTNLHFTSAVQLASGAWTNDVTVALGDSVALRATGAASLGVLPTFALNDTATNQTDLIVAGQLSASAGELRGFGETLGPLLPKQSTSGDVVGLSIVDTSFHVNMAGVVAQPFNLLFDASLAVKDKIESRGGYLMGPVQGDGTIDQVANLFDYFSTPFGQQYGCMTAFCNVDPASYGFSYIGEAIRTSQALVDDTTGDTIFINDLASLTDTSPQPVASDTDAGAVQRLAALGFDGSLQGFNTPAGDPMPSSIPEPSTLALLGMAFLALRMTRSGTTRAVRAAQEPPV
jgi:hypothetical protein